METITVSCENSTNFDEIATGALFLFFLPFEVGQSRGLHPRIYVFSRIMNLFSVPK